MDKFFKLENKKYVPCGVDEGEFVMIPRDEYNGMKNAVRIVNDRALQQIDKSQTDEYGFRFLRGEMRWYRAGEGYLYYVTKETPYSVNIEPEEARFLINHKFHQIFNWINEIDVNEYSETELSYLDSIYSERDVVKAVEQWNDARRNCNWLVDNNSLGKALFNAFRDNNNRFIVRIDKLSANYNSGKYEVSYWATEFI